MPPIPLVKKESNLNLRTDLLDFIEHGHEILENPKIFEEN